MKFAQEEPWSLSEWFRFPMMISWKVNNWISGKINRKQRNFPDLKLKNILPQKLFTVCSNFLQRDCLWGFLLFWEILFLRKVNFSQKKKKKKSQKAFYVFFFCISFKALFIEKDSKRNPFIFPLVSLPPISPPFPLPLHLRAISLFYLPFHFSWI